MASPTASLAYVELAPHSLHVAVLAGRKVLALRAFSLDAKADLAAFVAEHQLTGAARASLLGLKNYLHLSADAESGAVRQPAAFLSHAAKLPHGFESAPVAVACDAASGGAVDPVRVTPWLLAAVDSEAFAKAKETLGNLGLAPVDLTLAVPQHLGVVAASLSGDHTAVVLIPGEEEASIVWISTEGVQAIATAPLGYAQIFEAVQQGLGLKFKAAAGKLFYNDNYDFSEAAPKIAAPLAAALKSALEGRPASSFHIAGLTPGQSWLDQSLAAALGLKPLAVSSSALGARLGLDAAGISLPASASGLLELAAAGANDAAWVPPTLDVLNARSLARPKTAVPFPKTSAPASAAAAPAAPAAEAPKPATPAPKPAAPAPKAAPAPVSKPASAKPAPAPKPAAEPVLAVNVGESAAPESAPAARGASPAAASKSNKGPIFIAGALVAVAAIVGAAMTLRGPKNRPAVESASSTASSTPAAPAPAPEAPAAPAPAPAPTPARPAATAPVIAPQPAPAPIVVTPPRSSAPSAGAGDILGADARRFANDRYRLEITEKGFIQALATARDEVLVESAAGVSLQGSYVGTDGRRKWFNVGGVDDAGYQASVKKTTADGATVFNVKVTHPRFELEQSFLCLPESVKVSAKFTPINLRDPRGVIAAVHSVRLSPVALNPSLRMRAAADGFAYSMKAGTLRVGFDNGVWARDGADGKQTVIAGENGVAFHFTENTEAARNQLNYEIAMP